MKLALEGNSAKAAESALAVDSKLAPHSSDQQQLLDPLDGGQFTAFLFSVFLNARLFSAYFPSTLILVLIWIIVYSLGEETSFKR